MTPQRKVRMAPIGFLLFYLVLTASPAFPGQKQTSWLSPAKLEDITLFIINQERGKHGLAPLKAHPILKSVARQHSIKMVAERTLSHEFPGYAPLEKRLAASGLTFSAFAENVAKGDTITLRLIHEALMNSPGHRVNLLSTEISEIGIGIIIIEDSLYMTQVFARLFYPSALSALEDKLVWEIEKKAGQRRKPSPIRLKEIKIRSRKLLDKIFHDENPADLYDPHAPFTHLVLIFNQPDDALTNRLSEYILAVRAKTWDLSISFGRSALCPGGTYAVALCCQL